MRAGRLDILLETGAAWTRTVELYRPDTPIEAQAVTAGMRLFVDGAPALVYSVIPASSGRVSIVFGQGLYSDVTLTVPATARVQPAVAVEILEAGASFTFFPQDLEINPLADEVNVVIPTEVAPDGLSVTLALTADETADLALMEGPSSWDLYVQTSLWDWTRLLEGTLTIVKGDSR